MHEFTMALDVELVEFTKSHFQLPTKQGMFRGLAGFEDARRRSKYSSARLTLHKSSLRPTGFFM